MGASGGKSSGLFYLAHPIDSVGTAESGVGRSRVMAVWRERARMVAHNEGVGLYLPQDAFHLDGVDIEAAKADGWVAAINKINHRALAVSSGVLALLPAGVPSVGTPIEIERASNQGIPVAVVTDARGGGGWMLGGMARLYPHVRVFQIDRGLDGSGGSITQALEQALEWLVGQEYRVEQRRQVLPVMPVVDGATEMVMLPTRTYADDAGFDLYTSKQVTVAPGAFVDVPTGVAVQMEPYHWGMLTGRSSTLRNRGLLVQTGIIDPGYRGELYAGVFNTGRGAVTIEPGERVAQLIIMGNQTQTVTPVWAERLDEHPRGRNGFGSSGR